jgi:fimbrial isopeptide formation D2 family protein
VLSSTDGITWTQVTRTAGFSIRNLHSLIVFDDGTGSKLYLLGGNGTSARMNDVWSTTDGLTWTQATAAAAWDARYAFEAINYNDKMWIFGGNKGQVVEGFKTNEIWTSKDGINWTQETGAAEFPGRDFLSAAVFQNRVVLTGGDTIVGGSNDVWASSYDFSSMNFTVNSLIGPGGNPTPAAPGDAVPPCAAVDLTENDATVKAINWNFQDNSTGEIGFRLYDALSSSGEPIKEVATADINQIQEKENLATNKSYTRTVKAYNYSGTSTGTTPATCYTLASRPNQVHITDITADSISIKLDPNDGNPSGTKYAIRVISGTETNYVNPDGSFSPTESWHTYAGFGGANGVDVTGEILPSNTNINAALVRMALNTGQTYSFSAKAQNGDGIETEYSDSNASTPQLGTAPDITAVKGAAINLAWNSSFGLFATAWAGQNLFIDISGSLGHVLEVFSWLLNIILLILLIMFGLSLHQTIKYLKHDFKYPETFKLIWSILSREAQYSYKNHAQQTAEGVYHSSAYHQHKKLHNLSQQTFTGALVAAGLKLIILGALLSGIISLNHSGLAQTAPYNQSGAEVNVGDVLSYIVEVTNNGTASGGSLIISDTLSDYLTYQAGSARINKNGSDISAENINDSGNPLTFNIGDLGINESAYVVFSAAVNSNSENQIITNSAQINGANFTALNSNTTSNQVAEVVPTNGNINQAVPVCGNNVIETGEACDITGCTSGYECVNCRCISILPTNGNINQPTSYCGNGVIETGETCDILGCATDQECVNCQCQTTLPVNINENENINQPIVPPPGEQPPEIPIIGPIIDVFKDPINTVFNNPNVEQASQNIVTPILIIVAAVNTLPAVIILTLYLLPYLHLIFLEPFLLFFGKKRKKWGVVYNSLTKLPVDLVLVRLYNKKNNQLVQTKVTDREGRYIIIAKEQGRYYLRVTKPGFISPSRYLKDETQDTKYIDLYHGEVIEVTEKDAVITANIPLDPAEKKALAFSEVIRGYVLKNLRLIISYVGLILAIIVVLIIPTVITIGCLILHVILFLVFRRFLVPAKPKSWGIVYDQKNKEPLGSSVIRIFDIKFNKLLETQVTDRKGRYAFLVGKNQYQMLTEKPGYQKKEVKPVDLVKNEKIVNLDIGLNKV